MMLLYIFFWLLCGFMAFLLALHNKIVFLEEPEIGMFGTIYFLLGPVALVLTVIDIYIKKKRGF